MSEPNDDESENFFGYNNLRDLLNEDFALSSTEGITLFAKGCSLILFYSNDDMSKSLKEVWLELSQQFHDVNFFGVNLVERRDITKRIGELRNDVNHMFNKFTLALPPYIIVYRESNDPEVSYPQAFYNGPLTTEDLANWIVQLACQPGYTDYKSITYEQPVAVPVNTMILDAYNTTGRPEIARQYNGSGKSSPWPEKSSTSTPSSKSSAQIESRSVSRSPTSSSPAEIPNLSQKGESPTAPLNTKRVGTSGIGYLTF